MTSEISGGLRNALERGESIESARQSFINAGYKPEEIEEAIRELDLQTGINASQTGQSSSQEQPQYTPLPSLQAPKEKSYLWVVLLIILILILILGGLIVIYWKELSSLF